MTITRLNSYLGLLLFAIPSIASPDSLVVSAYSNGAACSQVGGQLTSAIFGATCSVGAASGRATMAASVLQEPPYTVRFGTYGFLEQLSLENATYLDAISFAVSFSAPINGPEEIIQILSPINWTWSNVPLTITVGGAPYFLPPDTDLRYFVVPNPHDDPIVVSLADTNSLAGNRQEDGLNMAIFVSSTPEPPTFSLAAILFSLAVAIRLRRSRRAGRFAVAADLHSCYSIRDSLCTQGTLRRTE